MMKLARVILVSCLLMLVLLPASASVQKDTNDPQGDVQGISGTVDMPNIDIKKVTYAQSDDGTVTVTIQVYGSIDPNSVYMATINTTRNGEETIYNIYYTKNKDFVYEWYGSENATELKAIEVISEDINAPSMINGTFDVLQGNILRIQYNLVNSSEFPITMIAITMFMEYSSEVPSIGMDNVTLKFELPSQNNDQQNNAQQNQNKNNKKGFPGFEVVLSIAAVSVAILLKKKKL